MIAKAEYCKGDWVRAASVWVRAASIHEASIHSKAFVIDFAIVDWLDQPIISLLANFAEHLLVCKEFKLIVAYWLDFCKYIPLKSFRTRSLSLWASVLNEVLSVK